MKKFTLLFFSILFSLTAANAQIYNTGIGIRGGYNNGLTVKHFISDHSAVEGIISSRWSGIKATALLEFHNTIGGSDNFLWYYGLGGHIGSYDSQNTPKSHPDNQNGSYTVIGVDAIVGIEYSFLDVPFNISLDYKPSFNLIGSQFFESDALALSLRYIF